MKDILRLILYETNYSNIIQINSNCVKFIGRKIVCDPSVFLSDTDWVQWQHILKIASRHNQNWKCICGETLSNSELHHALLTKADLRGVKNKERILHHSYNVIELCHECHEKINRTESYAFLISIFDEKLIQNWYLNVPMKVKPRILW